MKALKNYRYYVLTLLMCVALVGFLAVPSEDTSMGIWLLKMVVSKAVGIIFAAAAYCAYNYWSSYDELPELTQTLNRY